MMGEDKDLSKLRVADLLDAFPRAVAFFYSHKTACIGCYLARFCSLEDVIEAYRIDRGSSLSELATLLESQPISQTRSGR
jgi:hypothetical protein